LKCLPFPRFIERRSASLTQFAESGNAR
jgi:hypothetical protein